MSRMNTKKKDEAYNYAGGADPMQPRPFKVLEIKRELVDTFSMKLAPDDGGEVKFGPGQFNMLYVFGIGEVPISVSGDSSDRSAVVHTTRAVGKVSQALNNLSKGDIVGLRGPFGTEWPLAVAEGQDLVFVAGGIGLAPLRPAIYKALEEREKFGNIEILFGARTPEDILYPDELLEWKSRFDINVQVTVDRSTEGWQGRVGFVTKLVSSGGFNPKNTIAFTCGPEIMMLNVVKALHERGLAYDRIYLSMERNMKCAVGLCGHCQWGSAFVCRDGPVFRYDKVMDSLQIQEL
ncbi:MAG: FAD/NAD(P)-binding protein [Bdellovibrionales bacterium]